MQTGKAQPHEVRGHAAEDNLNFQYKNKPYWISQHEVLQS